MFLKLSVYIYLYCLWCQWTIIVINSDGGFKLHCKKTMEARFRQGWDIFIFIL